jgi:hypothetical protein
MPLYVPLIKDTDPCPFTMLCGWGRLVSLNSSDTALVGVPSAGAYSPACLHLSSPSSCAPRSPASPSAQLSVRPMQLVCPQHQRMACTNEHISPPSTSSPGTDEAPCTDSPGNTKKGLGVPRSQSSSPRLFAHGALMNTVHKRIFVSVLQAALVLRLLLSALLLVSFALQLLLVLLLLGAFPLAFSKPPTLHNSAKHQQGSVRNINLTEGIITPCFRSRSWCGSNQRLLSWRYRRAEKGKRISFFFCELPPIARLPCTRASPQAMLLVEMKWEVCMQTKNFANQQARWRWGRNVGAYWASRLPRQTKAMHHAPNRPLWVLAYDDVGIGVAEPNGARLELGPKETTRAGEPAASD